MENRTFKCEGERNDHMLHYEQVFGNVFERSERKCCAVLIKHEFEQLIIPQRDQQLKTLVMYQDNYFSVSVKTIFR